MSTKKSVLITRELTPASALYSWAVQRGMNIHAESFIRMESVAGLEIPETDWIFFSSPAGVRLFLEGYTIRAKRVAALSTGTAEVLVKHRVIPDFIGDAASDPAEIGRLFFSGLRKDESVLFPLSDISKRSVCGQANGQRVIELVTYRTTSGPKKIGFVPDVLVFTSPSNVRGFLMMNEIPHAAEIIALGKTTRQELLAAGCVHIHLPETTEERAIIRLLDDLLG